MRHIFIVNYLAGHGKEAMELIPKIDAYFRETGGAYEIVPTQCAGDATRIAREYAMTGEALRLYACGGDGTLSAVVNGAVGFGNVEVGCFPCGSGNDYVATFAKTEEFLDVAGQVEGSAVEIDLMLTEGIYSVNQCSMGFDAAVGDNVRLFKGKPLISGSTAYLLSIVYTFFGKLGHELTLTVDDGEPVTGHYLFAISAKGRYQGGGIHSAPLANPLSRTLHFVMVKAVNRFQFLRLLPLYLKGKHIARTDVVTSTFGRKLRITSRQPLPVVLDGEILVSSDITTELVPKGLKFILPARVAAKAEAADRPKTAAQKNF